MRVNVPKTSTFYQSRPEIFNNAITIKWTVLSLNPCKRANDFSNVQRSNLKLKASNFRCARMDFKLVLLVSGFRIDGLCQETHHLYRIWTGSLFLIIIAVSLILICFVN